MLFHNVLSTTDAAQQSNRSAVKQTKLLFILYEICKPMCGGPMWLEMLYLSHQINVVVQNDWNIAKSIDGFIMKRLVKCQYKQWFSHIDSGTPTIMHDGRGWGVVMSGWANVMNVTAVRHILFEGHSISHLSVLDERYITICKICNHKIHYNDINSM